MKILKENIERIQQHRVKKIRSPSHDEWHYTCETCCYGNFGYRESEVKKGIETGHVVKKCIVDFYLKNV